MSKKYKNSNRKKKNIVRKNNKEEKIYKNKVHKWWFEVNKVKLVKKIIKIISSIIMIAGTVLAIKEYYETKDINDKNQKNFAMNYQLCPVDDIGYVIEYDDVSFPIKPYSYAFNLVSKDISGDYVEAYFAILYQGELIIKKFENGIVDFIDINFINEKKDWEFVPGEDVNIEEESQVGSNKEADLMINMTNPHKIEMFHIILKGYNGEYQFFTVVSYQTLTSGNIKKLETEIFTDMDVRDNERIYELFDKIGDEKYADSKELQNSIIDSHKKIKQELE